jgi:dihydrofolate synthase/folylpolyglutamate synthase
MATTKSLTQTICDTAHNKEGLAIVLNQIQKEKYKQLHIILGVVNDKNLERSTSFVS